MAATAEIRPAAARLEREERGSSVLNVFDTGASELNVTAEGDGESGGSTDTGTAGSGGAGTALVTATSATASSVSGAATASRGDGGVNGAGGLRRRGGSATATANVWANGGAGSASAHAVGGASAIAALVSCELSGASTATLPSAQYCVRLNSQAKICNNAVPVIQLRRTGLLAKSPRLNRVSVQQQII
jgi:hypothetical protein